MKLFELFNISEARMLELSGDFFNHFADDPIDISEDDCDHEQIIHDRWQTFMNQYPDPNESLFIAYTIGKTFGGLQLAHDPTAIGIISNFLKI